MASVKDPEQLKIIPGTGTVTFLNVYRLIVIEESIVFHQFTSFVNKHVIY